MNKNTETTAVELPLVVHLSKSVEAYGEQVDSITLYRSPTVGDLIAAEGKAETGSSTEVDLLVLATLCKVPPSTLKSLQMPDWRKLQKLLGGFVSPGTGET